MFVAVLMILKTILLFSLFLIPLSVQGAPSKPSMAARSWSLGALRFKLTSADFQVLRDNIVVFSTKEKLQQELDHARMSAGVQPWSVLSANKLSKATYQVSIQPISVVGTLLSFRLSGRTAIAGEKQSIPWEHVSVWDLAAVDTSTLPRPDPRISLLDIWPNAVVLAGLLADPYARNLLPASTKPESLDALWKMLDGERPEPEPGQDQCSYDVFESTLRAFAFLRVEGDRVALQLHLTGASEQCRSFNKELTIWLPIPEKLRQPLSQANAGVDGYVLKDLERLGIPEYRVVTSLSDLLRSPGRRSR